MFCRNQRLAIWRAVACIVVGPVGTADTARCQTTPVAGKPAPFASTADPRDAKLLDLEARLAETERRLDAAAGCNGEHHAVGTQGDDNAAFSGQTVSAVNKRDDRGRMTALEKRFDELANKFKSAAGKKGEYPTARLTGFTQLDGGWSSQDPLNRTTVGNIQDGVGFRRTRLAVLGKAAEFTNYQLELDFSAAGRPSFFDTYAEQTNLPFFGTIRAGQYLQPFSVDAMSGFRNLPLLERSLPFLAFVPFRRVGVMAFNSTQDQRTAWAYSVFKTGGFNNAPLGDSRFATDMGDKGGYSFSTRVTRLVQYDEPSDGRYLWQVGGSFDFSGLGANTAAGSTSNVPFYQARTGPEFALGFPETIPATFGPASAFAATPNFVDTGRYAASNFNLYGLETVYQRGPFSLQAEWMDTQVNSVVGAVNYNGAYAEVMYRLTGEHRPYDMRFHALKNVIPFADFFSLRGDQRGVYGWGAWELCARWSYVDLRNPTRLNGHYLAGTNASGNGILNDATVGMTWFINAHFKFQFNWIHAILNNSAKGRSLTDLYVTRLQVDF